MYSTKDLPRNSSGGINGLCRLYSFRGHSSGSYFLYTNSIFRSCALRPQMELGKPILSTRSNYTRVIDSPTFSFFHNQVEEQGENRAFRKLPNNSAREEAPRLFILYRACSLCQQRTFPSGTLILSIVCAILT